MAERIGLTNNVTLEWMELVANCRISGKTQEEAYPVLNEKIAESIRSPGNQKRIRVSLFNMWYRPEDWFLEASTDAANGLPTDERIPIHWALLLKRYQVFFDLCTVIGGLYEFRDDITLAQIRNRIFEKWGARDTLQNCLPKNLQTIRELKAMIPSGTLGTYNRNIMTMENPQVMQLLCAAIIERSGKEYMTWEEIIQHPALFPFRISNTTQADMAACDHLTLERMGDDVVIHLKTDPVS